MHVYADNAATTAMSQAAIDAMIPCFRDVYGNPSSLHSMGQQAKEGTIWLYLDGGADAAELAEQACREVQTETPLGAYAVDYITYTIDTTARNYAAITLTIGYRRTAEQQASMVSVTSVTTAEAMEELIRGAAEAGREELTLRIHYFPAPEEEIRLLLQTLEQEYRGEYENEESASWSVEFYPSGGEQRIVEILLPNIS